MIRRRVSLPFIGCALALLLAAIEARAQSAAAPSLHVVVLATLPAMQRPPTPLPAAYRSRSLYWRMFKADNTVSYQLCLGFFDRREDAERARRELAASFREARVIQVDVQEREDLEKARQAAKPAPPPPAPSKPPAVAAPAPPVAAPAPPVAAPAPPVAAPAPPVAAPALRAPKAVATAGDPDALMAEGRGALVREDYGAAISAFKQIASLAGDSSLRRDAQEFLGLAYERRGETARARLEYESYLKQYPEDADSVRVRQRLTALAAAPQGQELHPAAAPTQTGRSFVTGSLSQFYYRGNSKIDTTLQQPLANTLDRTTLSLVDQSALITSVDLNARFTDNTHDNRVVFRDVNTQNFLSDTQNANRLYSLYYDYRYKPADASARLGRQPGSNNGLPGRFDGALLGYGFASAARLNLAAGEPVEPGISIDSKRRFYWVSAEVGPLKQRWSGNVYLARQTVDGIADREATGMELRYSAPGGFFASTLDYDTLFHHVNIGTVQGNWVAPFKTSFNFLLDYRMSPTLQTTNALIGEATTSIQALLGTYSEEELRSRARALTAQSRLASAGLTHPVTAAWQLGANMQVASISSTEGTNNFPATPASGEVYTLTGQAIGTGVIATRDVTVFSVSWVSAPTFTGFAGQFTSRLPVSANWTLEGALLGYGQDNDDGTTLRRISPVGRVSYRWRNSVTLEVEAGAERTNTHNATVEENSRRNFFSLGYRWDF
jgi:tetratricopeptide (TPR) repeat protein